MKKRLIIGLATALLIVVAVSAVQGRTDDEQDQILTEVTGALDRMPQVFINMPKNDPSGPRVLWADWATKKILTQAGEIADLQETVKRLVEGRIGGTSTAAAPIAAQPVVQDIVSQPAVDYASSLAKYTRAVDEQVIKNDQLIKEMSTGSVSATSTDPTVLNRLSEVEKLAKANQEGLEQVKNFLLNQVRTEKARLDEAERMLTMSPSAPCK